MKELTDLLAGSGVPGAVACWGDGGAAQLLTYGSVREDGPQVTAETRFDLASLTKVVATLPAVLRLASDGELDLDRPLSHWFAGAGSTGVVGLGAVTARQLLAHDGGLPAFSRVHTFTRDRLVALAATLQTSLEREAGTGLAVYSDVGFMLLGALVERISGERLDTFAARHIFGPLGMNATGFNPAGAKVPTATYAATEFCGWRNRLLVGEVHDENCFAWEGVSGHAGLFGTAADLGTYCRAWLQLDARLGREDLLAATLQEHARTEGGEIRGLGWVLGPAAFADRLPGFGHTGFTGTSLWLDRESGRFAVLLTNRVHPHRDLIPSITSLRAGFHRMVWL